jgi:hypothetical protein
VPLLRENQIIGSLSLNRKTPGAFPLEGIDVLKTLNRGRCGLRPERRGGPLAGSWLTEPYRDTGTTRSPRALSTSRWAVTG